MIVRLGISAICALVALGALGLAAPVLAQPHDHVNDAATFSVTQALGCPGFFTVATENVDGWNGRLHEAWAFTDPTYSNISISAHGTWTDASSGLGYRIRFDGVQTVSTTEFFAQGNVTISRSDGITLSGTAEFIGQEQLVVLQNITCS
jgi:hypothetical protein